MVCETGGSRAKGGILANHLPRSAWCGLSVYCVAAVMGTAAKQVDASPVPSAVSILSDSFHQDHAAAASPRGSDPRMRAARDANTSDCDTDGVEDVEQIAAGDAADADTNGTPDRCENDCNTNGTADSADIMGGTSLDADSNGTPDRCDEDCNTNGTADIVDITGGTSFDLDRDRIPDECRPRSFYHEPMGSDWTFPNGFSGYPLSGGAGPAPLYSFGGGGGLSGGGGGGGGGAFPSGTPSAGPSYGPTLPPVETNTETTPPPDPNPTNPDRPFSKHPTPPVNPPPVNPPPVNPIPPIGDPIPPTDPVPPQRPDNPPDVPPPVPEPATALLVVMAGLLGRFRRLDPSRAARS